MNQTKLILILVLTYLLLYCAMPLRAQFSYSIHYTVNEGLPSSKIYDMIQDSRGYIWFATENGVSQFNGHSFKNFTTREGLPTNSTVKLFEDVRGRIWFLSYHGSLSYFENGKVHGLQINAYLNEINIPFVSHMYIDSLETMWISPFSGGLYKLKEGQQIKQVGGGPENDTRIYLYLNIKADGYILAYIDPDTKLIDGQEDIIVVGEKEYYFGFDMKPTENHYGFLDMNDYYLVSFGKKVYQVENDKIAHKLEFREEIIGINHDQQDNMWISEKFNGVFQYNNGIKSAPVNHFFKGLTISKVLQDAEGNYWFSTTENGVYFVPSIEIKNYNNTSSKIDNDIILTLGIHGNKLYFSTDGKGMYYARIEGDSLTDITSLNFVSELMDNVYSILPVSDNEVYATGNYMNSSGDLVVIVKRFGHTINLVNYGYDLYQLGNGDIIVLHGNGYRLVRGTEIVYKSVELINTRIFAMELDKDSSFWLGTIKGLFKLKNNDLSRAFPDDPVLNSRISVLKMNKDELWAGSFDNGLVFMSNDSIYYLNQENGLSSNRVKSIFLENDSICWIGTNRGLNKVSVFGKSEKTFLVEVLDIWDGLSSNEINEIIKYNGFLWLGTDKGLVSFNPAHVKFRHDPPRLYLGQIQVDGIGEISMENPADLSHQENNITFGFNGICFKDPESIIYTYKLEGLNAEWSETKNTSVRFHDLPARKYTFMVKAKIKSGEESEIIQYSFIIHPHFTQTLLFLISIFLLGGLLVFGLVYYFVSTQKKRNTLQRQFYLAEQKAMLAQMNPHFIFNSLNSIQNFILDNDSKNANIYLVTFSSLIRKILDASQRNYISLKEELETISLYLDLEKFRFDEKFDYHIEVNSNINADNVSLPSMILQPYLENAIWHGIVPKEDHGLLQLIVSIDKQEGIIISIIDDGIGRDKSMEISKRRKHHKSTGIKNVEERIGLLNTLNKTKMHVNMIDLMDEKGESCGTRVDFYLGWSEELHHS